MINFKKMLVTNAVMHLIYWNFDTCQVLDVRCDVSYSKVQTKKEVSVITENLKICNAFFFL